ncbi:MAG: NB-ARC domain-containing protein, partial [Anaerolineales bacterium]
MNPRSPDFNHLSTEYQQVIKLAQQEHGFEVVPLRELKGGRTAARLYLVSVSINQTQQVEHYILKIDRVHKKAALNEIKRHINAQNGSSKEFVYQHMPKVAYDTEREGVIAIFYSIAGQSLQDIHPLAFFEQSNRLEIIFRETNQILLTNWNAKRRFNQAVHPRSLLDNWLGYRLKAGGNIESFLEEGYYIPPGSEGLLISGNVFPNPYVYARQSDHWEHTRPIDAMVGNQHGDLNIGNILVNFSGDSLEIDDYYLIDFALYKPDMPLLYDQRYLEVSYLLRELERAPFSKWVEFVSRYAVEDMPNPQEVPVDLAGACTVVNAGREAFKRWTEEHHPSLSDDLWGQFLLAGVAAGLNYCNKTSLPETERLAGLIFAAAHMKRYCSKFGTPFPVNVRLLYDPSRETERLEPVQIPPEKEELHHNLPVQLTSFIGREREMQQVKELITREGVYLVTLTGPGGTGKTRLSLQVAHQVLTNFRHGVVFVPLAEISDPGLVISQIAQQLGVREAGGQSLMENLRSYLRGRQTLLLLDNFEQVVEAAPFVAELLAGAPRLKILVTSRTLLNLRGEFEYFVPPLKLPEDEQEEDLTQVESVALFLERARSTSSQFQSSPEVLRPIAEICRKLDGLPLAIELAAARIRVLPPQVILERLSDRLTLLTGGARDLPTRQQTLRNTIDWSYELLEEGEKTLFARLGVFVGGFTFKSADAICSLVDDLDVISGITVLLENSLIRRDQDPGDSARFRMLETIREYALMRLEERGEVDELRKQHADYFTDIMTKVVYEMYSGKGNQWLRWLAREYDNLRAVMSRSLNKPEDLWQAMMVMWALFWFWYRRGYFYEGRRWLEWGLSTPIAQGQNQIRGFGLLFNGIMAMWQGDLSTGLANIDESLKIWHHLEDEQGLGISFLFQGFGLLNQGKNAEARDLLVEALKLFKGLNFPWQVADTLVHLGNAAMGLGDLDDAWERLAEAEKVSRQVGDNWLIAL